MINDVYLSGNVANDVKYTHTKNGQPKARFNIAYSYGKDDNKITEFYTVDAFGSTADFAKNHLNKGNAVTVVGRLHHYSTKVGNGKYNDYRSVIARTLIPSYVKAKQSKTEKKLFEKNDALAKKVSKISKKVGIK